MCAAGGRSWVQFLASPVKGSRAEGGVTDKPVGPTNSDGSI